MASKITTENWNTAYYYSDNLIAFVSIGAIPDSDDLQYYVTLSNKDYEDLYQSTHKDLEGAVATLNEKYGDWQIKGLEQEGKSDDGCSGCVAH